MKAMDCMARLCTSFNLLSEPCARPCKLQSYLITLSVFFTGFCSVGGKRKTCPTEDVQQREAESVDRKVVKLYLNEGIFFYPADLSVNNGAS